MFFCNILYDSWNMSTSLVCVSVRVCVWVRESKKNEGECVSVRVCVSHYESECVCVCRRNCMCGCVCVYV